MNGDGASRANSTLTRQKINIAPQSESKQFNIAHRAAGFIGSSFANGAFPIHKSKRPARDWPCKPFCVDCWLKTSSVRCYFLR
jgi:hypothetical protein